MSKNHRAIHYTREVIKESISNKTKAKNPSLTGVCLAEQEREISSQLTWISTELDALAPVGDSFSCVAGVDDMAFIPCGAMQRLISILSGAAGLSCKRSLKIINCGFITPR